MVKIVKNNHVREFQPEGNIIKNKTTVYCICSGMVTFGLRALVAGKVQPNKNFTDENFRK